MRYRSRVSSAYRITWHGQCAKRYALPWASAMKTTSTTALWKWTKLFLAPPRKAVNDGASLTNPPLWSLFLYLPQGGKPQFAKMQVVDTIDGETVAQFAHNTVVVGSELHADGLPVYAALANKGYTLVQQKYDPKGQPKHLHWTHIIISNAKAFIGGTFHGLDSVHLQRYLNEFCYRLNRRWHHDLAFSRLLCAVILAGKALVMT